MAKSAAAALSSVPSRRYRITKPTIPLTKRRSRSLDNSASQRTIDLLKDDLHNLPTPRSGDFNAAKRKHSEREGESTGDEPRTKKNRTDSACTQVDGRDLVDHWLKNEFEWSSFLKKTTTMDDGHSQKRSISRSNSYRQSTISGDTPKAWGAKHAPNMLESGIFMEKQEGAAITDDDSNLCKTILEARYDLPKEWRFRGQNFLTILRQVMYKNERRVVRDLEPHIMPSPELLKAQGYAGLDHIAEAVDAQWAKCTSLCGPKSKPDVCHGVSRFIFTRAEREKLTSNNTCACETMLFPFYICEAKCFDKSIEESELQALHGASVAGNAVIELYRKLGAAEELDRRILAFSVSHNQRAVKIFAHFALIDGGETTFHRHQLFVTDLIDDASNRTRPFHVALAIWEHFYPIHLARIRDALARQRDRAVESFTAQLGLQGQSQSGTSTPTSSQDDAQNVVKLQEDIVRLLSIVREHQEELRHEREEHKKQREFWERQLERQSKQYEEQMEQQKEIIALLKQSR